MRKIFGYRWHGSTVFYKTIERLREVHEKVVREVDAYLCPVCNKAYMTDSRAMKCCEFKPKKTDRYACMACCEVYDSKNEAESCKCEHFVVFECKKCDPDYYILKPCNCED